MSNLNATTGLSTPRAQELLAEFGPNAVAEEKPRPILLFLRKFWSPVLWMLQATLELVLG